MTNAEFLKLYNKPGRARIQPECRCPNDFPRNEDESSSYCIKNLHYSQDKVRSLDRRFRLNKYAHSVEQLNDDDFQTSWISCIVSFNNSIAIVLDFQNGAYITERIEVYFVSLPPAVLAIEKFDGQRWELLQTYSSTCSESSSTCRPFSS